MGINREILNSLVDKCRNPAEVHKLLADLTKGLMERALEGEMTAHLGYGKNDISGNNSGNSRNGHSRKRVITDHGELEIAIPRDRNGEFEPQMIPKNQRRFEGFDDKILSMYALGMSTRDIQSHLKEIYKVDVSPDLISQVTDEIVDEVRTWQQRPLQPLYSIVYLDALWVKVRENNRILNKALYLALGVDMDGNRDLLGFWIEQNEGARFWLNVVSELQNRGVRDILIACVDGLKGFPQAIEAVFPQTNVQLCIVHMVRNSFKYVANKNSRVFTADLKKVYQAVSLEAAEHALRELDERWGKLYPGAVNCWKNSWEHLSVMFQFPAELRRLVYTTNPIESLNASLRKVVRNKKMFPSDEAVFKQIYMAYTRIETKWNATPRQWNDVRNQLHILFEERIKNSFTQNS